MPWKKGQLMSYKHLATNPYLPGWEYVPDGEPHVFGDRVYVFGSHDAPEGTAYCPGDYVCWSAPVDDLGAWTFEGTIWRKADDPQNTALDPYFAPDVCQGADGRFYLYYFYLSRTLGPVFAVSVCDEPAGRYRYLGRVCLPTGEPLTAESGFGMPFDPAVLACEDGGCWLYYGFGAKKRSSRMPASSTEGSFVVRLGADMRTMVEDPKRLAPGFFQAEGTGFEGHAFFEASSIRELDGRYYFVYSSEHGHELCWAIMPTPEGPVTYGGVLVSNGDVGLPGHETEDAAVMDLANNHGGMVRIAGRDYIFYHRHTHGAQHARQGCAEPIEIAPDGSIAQVEITSCGLNGGALPCGRTYAASICCHLMGPDGAVHYAGNLEIAENHPVISQEVDTGCTTSARTYVSSLCDGASVGYKYLAFTGAERTLELEVRGDLNGTLVLRLDAPDGAEAARVEFAAGDGWHTVTAGLVPVESGDHALYLTVEGAGSVDLASFTIL